MTTTTQIIEVDPSTLSSNVHNPREHFRDLDRLVASIKAQGILQPLVVATSESGGYVILAGHRRAAAAVEAGLATVPVVVRDDLAHDADALGVILAENVNRDALSTGEEAKAVQDLLDLGLSVHKIASRTGLRRKRVQQVATVAAASADVREQIAQREATLDEALALSEFSDDAETVTALSEYIGTPEFAYKAQRARDERTIAQRLDKALGEYRSAGVTAYLAHNSPDTSYADQLGYEHDITDEQHAECGDRYVIVRLHTADGELSISEHCANIAQHPKRTYGSSSKPMSELNEEEQEAKRAERRQVIANNKAMDASNTVRRAWLRDLLAAKRPALGKNATTMIARLYAANARQIDKIVTYSGQPMEYMPEIEWPHGEPDETTPAPIAQAYLFAFIAKAIEQPLHRNEDKTVWRDTYRLSGGFRDWLATLETLGYQPSPIERAIINDTIADYTDEG